jgi:ribA/ribD-fused uncharacterized protein
MTRKSKHDEEAPSLYDERMGMISSFTGEWEFLSNFYREGFAVKSLVFPTAEHAYQAAKTTDPVWREDIRKARTPASAKRLGRACPIRADWEDVKVNVMRVILAHKFAARTPLATALVLTGGRHLVEGNTWGDKFWGCVREPSPQGTLVGANHLGILLMQRRRELQNEIPY